MTMSEPSQTPIPQLLAQVQEAGVDLVTMHPDRILMDGHLPEELVQELRDRAREVVACLAQPSSSGTGAQAPPPTPSGGGPTARPAGRDLRAELEGEDGTYPEAWRPEVGEILVGELTGYDQGTTPYGPAVIARVVDEATGETWSVWLIHHVLLDEFRKLRPKPGERVGLKRLEDADHYRRYSVRVDRPQDELPDLLEVAAQEGLPGAQPPRESPGQHSAPPPPPRAAPQPSPPITEPDDDLPF
jgi:hypothetical protein